MALDFLKKNIFGKKKFEVAKNFEPKSPMMLDMEVLVPHEKSNAVMAIGESVDEIITRYNQLGIIEPIVVKLLENGKYQILIGERRWRAAKKLNLKQIPCFVQKKG